jgi:hypothetical protein
MRPKYFFAGLAVLLVALIPFMSARLLGQTSSVPSRIQGAVDNTKLTVLRGNTHLLARPEFDRGPAPASLPLDHMMLVLTRSPQQEASLETLLAQQQSPSSPNFHKWLTPEQFGQQFGPSDQDIQTITSWLQSNGFQVNSVANGRTTIDFSGTAGQVQQAFHTSIHSYVLANGEQHWANASDPQIPTALTAVVAGVNSLNNFRRKAFHTSRGIVRKDLATGKFARIRPQYTFAGEPDGLCEGASGTSNCWAVGPGDFATIYNVPPTIGGANAGAGETIAIVSDSDVYATDVTAFRSIFGLPTATETINNSPACTAGTPCFDQIETGTDPGVQGPNSASQDEEEAILDVEWSGAVAPYATIDLVVSPTTNSTFGGDTSAAYIINCPTVSTNCPVAVPASALSYSYGDCELALGSTLNQMYNTMWQQAAGEGITVLVATGDSGSAACDQAATNTPSTMGLAVTGEASTPYNVAVGGTDFNDFSNPTTYWNSTNATGSLESAKGYIPETTYNDTCTNSIVYGALSFGSAEAACNSATVEEDGLLGPGGGGGGVSNCTTPTGPSPSTCAGGYAKPAWQAGTGVPSDGKRDIPDISLFAGDGTIQNFYIDCEADADLGDAPCSLTAPPVLLNGSYYVDFQGIGGTSVSAQAFAGVVALIDQKMGGKQGNINPVLYGLASGQSASSIFNDVTLGTNAMPCIVITGTPGCSITGSNSYTIGVLTGYNAGAGYDLTTGLGSVNVGNLINDFASITPTFYLSSANPTVTVASPGASGALSMVATAVGGFTGTVNLSCSGLPTGASCGFSPGAVTFTSTTTNVPVTVTVSTTAAGMLAPAGRLDRPSPQTTRAVITFTGAFLLVVFLVMTSAKQSRSSMALASTAFALLIGIVACGGGSSSSTTGGGTPTPTPSASVIPTSLTFTSQNTNTTSTAQTVTLTNAGTASLTVSSITASANFGQTNTCGTSVAAGGNCTIQVTFTPTTTGALTGTLTIQDNAANSPLTVGLTGTGTSPGTPNANIAPTSLTFGSQITNTSSAAQTITLSNSGTVSLAVSSITASANFSQTNNCGTSVAAGGNCAIQVTFKPTTTGALTGTLTIQDNAAGSPQTASLTGTGNASGGTPTGTSTVTITGTNGTISVPLTFTLTVQ